MSSDYSAETPHRGSVLSRSFLPLALITLGVVFLLGNLVSERSRGGLVVLGLGVAFFIGRATTGRYGYAVPAGILLGIGSYIGLQDVQALQPVRGGGLFFVLLGLGFALVYLIGMRPAAVWPLFPAAVLIGLGLLFLGVASLGAVASLSWIVGYWPVALVVLGVWLLFRDHLPAVVRGPLATLGGMALLAYGIVAAAASIASSGVLPRAGQTANFGSSPSPESVTLDWPIAAGQTLTVSNSSGRTTIHGNSTTTTIHVVATTQSSFNHQRPDVRFSPTSNGVALDATDSRKGFPFGGSSSVDYAIDLPSQVAVVAQDDSGRITIDGVTGNVQATSNSGALTLSNLGADVQAQTGSGAIELSNIGGDVRATTRSGRILGTGLHNVREAATSTGSISLDGTFTRAGQVGTSSGSISVKLQPGSAIRLDVRTGSGSVNPRGGLQLTDGATSRQSLTGNLGSPAAGAVLSIQTSSGSIEISQ